MRFITFLLSALLPTTALAVPLEFTQQGRLLDSSGNPLTGPHEVDFAIYADSATSTPLWSQEEAALDFADGYYVVRLGSDSGNPLQSDLFDGSMLYLGIAVDSGPELSDRVPMGSVPYAVLANSVAGGAVDATSLSVAGDTIIDSTGALLRAHLGGLSCSDNQFALYSGGSWTCASPVGDADIAALGYAKTSDLAAVANSGSWNDLSDVPAWLTGVLGLSCGGGEVISHDDSGAPVCAEPSVSTGAGLQGDGTSASPLVVDLEQTVSAVEGGLKLEAETKVAGNASAGAAATDSTASGGGVRLGEAGGSYSGTRLWGLHTTEHGALFSTGPARVVFRMKVSDNSSTSAIASMGCTANRDWNGDGSTTWAAAGAGGAFRPADFDAPDTWQTFEIHCPNLRPDDTSQFIGVDGFTTGIADLAVDYVKVIPEVDRGPRIWRFKQSGDISVTNVRADAPGLVDQTFSVPWPATLHIQYTAQVHNSYTYDGQHCAAWAVLDGSDAATNDTGSYGLGFLQFSNINALGNQSEVWWHYGTLHSVVDVNPGTHDLTIQLAQGWTGSTGPCVFSRNYGGGELIVTAYPR